MRLRPLRFTLAVAGVLALELTPLVAGVAQSQTPYKYSRFAYSFYSEARIGYEMAPVQLLGLRGGKLGTHEKLKIAVSVLHNKTEKNIRALKFKTFIFSRSDLNEVLETVHTPLVAIDVPALTKRECDLLILYADDIPLLAYKPGEEYRLETAVTEVHYDDGTIWEAKNLPGKLDSSKMR
jgi:hypothetical protein